MGLSHTIITILLILSVCIGVSGFYGSMASNPSYNMNYTNFNTNFTKQMVNMTNKINSVSETFTNASNNPPSGLTYVLFTAPLQYIYGAIQVALLFFDIPDMMNAIITDLAGPLMIPTWIISIAYTIVIVSIIFAIIYFVTSKR